MARLAFALLTLSAVLSISFAKKTAHLPIHEHLIENPSKDIDEPELIEPELDEPEIYDVDVTEADRRTDWVNCDWLSTPRLSCYNCFTRMICKPTGGILKPCDRYCNNGLCSDIPSDGC